MKNLLSFIVALAAWLLIPAGAARTMEGPPDVLIRENCAKAQAIMEGSFISSETQPNQFTQTRFRVEKVYRGPFHPGEELTYFSFRESARRNTQERGRRWMVFLISRTGSTGLLQWGTVTDFSEFPASHQLKSKVTNCIRRKRP